MISSTYQTGGRRPRWGAALAALAMAGLVGVGCDSLIDVDNPNNVTAEDLLDPTAATAVANGSLFTVSDGYSYMLLVYSDVADELTWVGSRDAFQELDFGNPTNPANEFLDQAFILWAQGIWMSREAIEILEAHQADGALGDSEDLARAYLYGAITRTVTADWMEDITFSDLKESGPPVGEDNMNSLYTEALSWIDAGLALAPNGSDTERNLQAWKARTLFSSARWDMLGRKPVSITNNGLISSVAARDAAAAALALDNGDWVYEFEYSSSTLNNEAAQATEERLELRVSDDYIVPLEPARKERDRDAPNRGIALIDPVSGDGDARIDEFLTPYEDQNQYGDLRIVTAREMRLIMAEHELATNGNTQAFQDMINDVRDAGGMDDWDGTTPVARDMLIHERRANLFLGGQRLNDMYRFGIQSANWQATSPAASTPGTFFPISKTERDANCHLNPDFQC